MLVDMIAPNGCVIHAREDIAESLLAAGFKRADATAPKKSSAKKTTASK